MESAAARTKRVSVTPAGAMVLTAIARKSAAMGSFKAMSSATRLRAAARPLASTRLPTLFALRVARLASNMSAQATVPPAVSLAL